MRVRYTILFFLFDQIHLSVSSFYIYISDTILWQRSFLGKLCIFVLDLEDIPSLIFFLSPGTMITRHSLCG